MTVRGQEGRSDASSFALFQQLRSSTAEEQIAKRSVGNRHGSITSGRVAEPVFDFVRLGIVEAASASGPIPYRRGIGRDRWRRMSKGEQATYRFRSYDRFVKMAEEIPLVQGASQSGGAFSILPWTGFPESETCNAGSSQIRGAPWGTGRG